MELLNLFAKLVLDSSEFRQGIEEAKSEADGLSDSLDGASGSFDDLADSMTDSGDAAGDSAASQSELSDSIKESTSASGSGSSALDKYKAVLDKVKSAAAAMVAVKVAQWLWDTTAAVAAYGDHIDKASQKMGMMAKSYQEWAFIAEHSGTSIDSLSTSMRTLANQAATNRDAFEALGMSFEEVQKMSQEELFENTIRALQNVEDTAERTRIASKLLGRAAMELGPLFNSSGDDIDKMKDRIAELGGVMSDKFVKQSAAYEDAMTDLQTAVQGAKNNIASLFMEFNTNVILAAADALGYLNNAFREFTQADVSPEEKLQKMKTALEGMQQSYESFKDVDPLAAQSILNMIDSQIAKINELEAEIQEASGAASGAIDEQQAKLAELQAAFSETYESISSDLKGWFGAFDNATYEITTSAEEMMTNLQSQADFWENYEQNLHKLSDAGFGDLVEAIEEMGPAGAQYADVLAGMVDGGDEAAITLQDISEKMSEVNEKREKAAETSTAIKFVDNSDETIGNIDAVITALNNLDGRTATVTIITENKTKQEKDGDHAGGLDYVPYHNYHAVLHEGERVLTKEENEAYTNGMKTQEVIINQYIESKPQSPVEIAAATAAYLEQARWAV